MSGACAPQLQENLEIGIDIGITGEASPDYGGDMFDKYNLCNKLTCLMNTRYEC